MKTQIIKYLPWILLAIVIGMNHRNIKTSKEVLRKLDNSVKTCHYELKMCKFIYKQGN